MRPSGAASSNLTRYGDEHWSGTRAAFVRVAFVIDHRVRRATRARRPVCPRTAPSSGRAARRRSAAHRRRPGRPREPRPRRRRGGAHRRAGEDVVADPAGPPLAVVRLAGAVALDGDVVGMDLGAYSIEEDPSLA